MASADYATVAQDLYVAYFGRPADTLGLINFESQLDAAHAPTTAAGLSAAYSSNAAVKQIIDSFGNSAESASLYGTGTASISVFVTAIYHNLFNRDPDFNGLVFWSNAISSGGLPKASAALNILAGALANTEPQGLLDAQTITKKVAVAANFDTAINTVAEINAYNGDAAAATARAMLSLVDSSTDVIAFNATVDATLATIVNAPVPGKTLTLTAGIDQGAAFVGGPGNDTFVGLLDSTTGVATLNAFDSIDGSAGTNTLSITDSVAADKSVLPAGIALANIQKMVFQTAGNAGDFGVASFDVSTFTSLTDLTVSSAAAAGDHIKASATQNVTVAAIGGKVKVVGGLADTVTAKGTISITGAAGAVSATDTATGAGSTVSVTGGTTVTVSTKDTGLVTVGSSTDATQNASDAISVTASKGAEVDAYGGTNVTVSTAGVVIVGATGVAPTGTVTVTQASLNGANTGDVAIVGGTAVTVTTAGGGAGSAIGITKATGAVNVTDTNTTLSTNADAIAISGGTTVNVTTTATSAAASVGTAATLNSAGTGLSAATLASAATGNVAVTNGSSIKYGAGTTDIHTNGATSVTIVGGGAATIEDVQTKLATAGANAGLAVGTSTLASVSLDHVVTSADITSDALTSISLTNSKIVATDHVTPAHALAITSAGNSGSAGVTDATATSVAITTTGTAADTLALNAVKATSLSIGGTDAFSLTTGAAGLAKVTGLTLSGSGAVTANVSDTTTNFAKLTSVTATGSSGNNVITIDALKTSFAGGSGNDTVAIAAAPTKAIAGAGGTNELDVSIAGPFNASANVNITGFQTLGLGAAAVGTGANGYDATGFTALHLYGTMTGAVEFTNVAAGTVLNIDTVNLNQATTYTLLDATGSSDALTINLGKSTDTGITSTALTANGIENVTVNSAGKTATSTNTLVLTDDKLATLTINGADALSTSSGSSAATITTVNAAGSSGAIDVTSLVSSFKATGVTITGGAGKLTATGGAGTDVITTGSGGGAITVGTGGLVGGTATLTYAAGSETINLAASSAKVDTVTQIDKGDAAVSGFGIGGTTADKLAVAASSVVLANSAVAATGTSGLNYAVSNGVISFSGAGPVLLSSFSDAQLIQAAATILDLLAANTNAIFASQNGTDSYVISSDAGSTGAVTLTKLTGVTGLQGFGTTAAGHTVLTTGLANTLAGATALAETSGSTAAVRIDDATGFSLVNEASLSAGGRGTTSTTFANLAAAAEVDVSTAAFGTLITTQVGAAGQNSLTVGLSTGAVTLTALNVTGDSALVINEGTAAKINTITSLVDGAATDTLATVTVTGTHTDATISIAAISDTALTTVDASGLAGVFSLGSGAAIFNAGLTVKGGTGNNTIVVSGANDIITVSGTAAAAAETITASGDNTQITLTHAGSTGNVSITAAGNGDTIDVSGWVESGAHTVAITALGSGDTIKLGVGNATAVSNYWTATVGANASVVVGGAFENIDVSDAAATAGATSAGSFHYTTVSTKATVTKDATDLVTFDAINALQQTGVNVSGATTLAAALDIAAKATAADTNVDWFQYGGDTYVVQTGSHGVALASADIVVKVVGLVDLSDNSIVGTASVALV